MSVYLIGVVILFFVCTFFGRLLENDSAGDYSLLWGLALSVAWPLVVPIFLIDLVISYLVKILKKAGT